MRQSFKVGKQNGLPIFYRPELSFQQRVEAIAEVLPIRQDDFDRERKVIAKQWQSEKNKLCAVTGTALEYMNIWRPPEDRGQIVARNGRSEPKGLGMDKNDF